MENKFSKEQPWCLLFEEQGKLMLKQQENRKEVFIKSCFPWSHPMNYFSLRDHDDNEVVLVQKLSELDKSSQSALLKSLQETGFCFTVKNLLSVKEDFELRTWNVETEQGTRSFQTKLLDWPRELENGSLIIQDIYGDIYFVEDVSKLPMPGKEIMWAFID